MALASRFVLTLALLAAVATASCDRARNAATAPAGASNNQGTVPPAIRYEDHVWAGGIAPPGGRLANSHGDDAESAKNGERLFSSMNCDGCHGGAGSGWVGPSLADGRWRYGGRDEEIFSSIFYGRPKGMPAYGGVIGSDGVWLLVSYLKSLAKPDAVPTESWIATEKTVAVAAASAATATPTELRPAPADFGLNALLQKNSCTACHAINRKVVGPAYKDVAAKYRGHDGAEQKLFASVKNGSTGAWGPIPMPPNVAVSDDDARRIVKQILSLK